MLIICPLDDSIDDSLYPTQWYNCDQYKILSPVQWYTLCVCPRYSVQSNDTHCDQSKILSPVHWYTLCMCVAIFLLHTKFCQAIYLAIYPRLVGDLVRCAIKIRDNWNQKFLFVNYKEFCFLKGKNSICFFFEKFFFYKIWYIFLEITTKASYPLCVHSQLMWVKLSLGRQF